MCRRNELNDSNACRVIGDIKGFSAIIGFLGFGWMNLLKKRPCNLPYQSPSISFVLPCLPLYVRHLCLFIRIVFNSCWFFTSLCPFPNDTSCLVFFSPFVCLLYFSSPQPVLSNFETSFGNVTKYIHLHFTTPPQNKHTHVHTHTHKLIIIDAPQMMSRCPTHTFFELVILVGSRPVSVVNMQWSYLFSYTCWTLLSCHL